MAALVRLGVMTDLTAEGEADLERVLSGLSFRLPQVYQSLREVSRVETRRFLRDRGVRGTTLPGIGEVYMVTVPATVIDVTQRVCREAGEGTALPSCWKDTSVYRESSHAYLYQRRSPQLQHAGEVLRASWRRSCSAKGRDSAGRPI